jgi:glycosyltransferase involved in cell wall biosynthesis
MARYHLALLGYAFLRHRSILHVIGMIEPPLLCGILEGLWFRFVNRRYILTIHNLLPHDNHSAFNRFAYWWSYRIPHRLVVHTARMKHELVEQFGLDSGRIVIMEHGIEPAASELTGWGDWREANAVPVILVFGTIAPYKGLDLLLKALNSTQFPFRLIIAGVCSNTSYREQLQSLIAEHLFRSCISWLDSFVSESEMEQLFKAADLVVLPYRHIDQSGVLFQALRFGVPVVATRVGLFADYVTGEIGEIAIPENTEDLAAALNRWAMRRDSFSRPRIREIGKVYEWPKTVVALTAAYQ